MKVEDQSPSSKDEDLLSQTQDPLERRRLQNRLSQRNHRRKIRERIAKLQERVIANELRAAAALNGWDQGYHPSAFTPGLYPGYSEHDFTFSSRDTSPLGPEQNVPFIQPCPPFSGQYWPNDLNVLQSTHVHTGNDSQFGASDASSTSPITSGPMQLSNNMPSPRSGCGVDGYRELTGMGDTLMQGSTPESVNQPMYYVATEAALPQILQVINTMSPQSKVIVLVPPESPASTSMTPFPSSPSQLARVNVPGNSATQQQNSHNLVCLCYPHNLHPGAPAQSSLRTWTGAGTYTQSCPLHKMMPPALASRGFSRTL